MKRARFLESILSRKKPWDVIIIGGGATGAGAALDAALRGYDVLLLEQHDFGKATSSRSTKLAHGGVRYLRKGNIPLVLEGLHERSFLRKQAPHLVHERGFIIPSQSHLTALFYGLGLKLYDTLAWNSGFPRSKILSGRNTRELISSIRPEVAGAGVLYYDGQFDDSRLNLNIIQTAVAHGACVLNYAEVIGLETEDGKVRGLRFSDQESKESHTARGRVVINAAGPFCDEIRALESGVAPRSLVLSKGVHVVVPGHFLKGDYGILVPHTDDNRVLFILPWNGTTLLGTTDTKLEEPSLEPRVLAEDVNYILEHTARYISPQPTHDDVLSVFAGIRPLAAEDAEDTASVKRDHFISISEGGLVSIRGGKWTTYRKMAEDVVTIAAKSAGLPRRNSHSRDVAIHGATKHSCRETSLSYYGTDADKILELEKDDPTLAEQLHPELQLRASQVIWAARNEMARSVEDVLARRHRALFINARAAVEVAPVVARLLAAELTRDDSWVEEQCQTFSELAARYDYKNMNKVKE